MNPVALIRSQQSLQRTQWLNYDEIKNLQEKKLKYLVAYAYQHVPYYTRLFDNNKLNPSDIRSLADLQKIPITTKADLQVVPAVDRVSDDYSLDALITEHSSGSTGQPFTAYFDKAFVITRNNMFLRALRNMGYRPGKKLMLITAGHNRKKPWLRWFYTSIENSAEELVDQLNKFRPDVLYGCTTPLRLMAQHIQNSGQMPHQPEAVISTAETLDRDTRVLLERTFGARVYDLYGLTEMGLVAWQCNEQDGYHLSEDTTIIEFEYDQHYQANKLIMTNLELKAMPLIRYQTGDLAKVMDDNECTCGRQLQRIECIEGRMIDCIQLNNNSVISPYRITMALEKIAGLGRYQLLQNETDLFTVRIEDNNFDHKTMKNEIKKALLPVLGVDAKFVIEVEDSISPPPGKKFRVVESRLQNQDKY